MLLALGVELRARKIKLLCPSSPSGKNKWEPEQTSCWHRKQNPGAEKGDRTLEVHLVIMNDAGGGAHFIMPSCVCLLGEAANASRRLGFAISFLTAGKLSTASQRKTTRHAELKCEHSTERAPFGEVSIRETFNPLWLVNKAVPAAERWLGRPGPGLGALLSQRVKRNKLEARRRWGLFK